MNTLVKTQTGFYIDGFNAAMQPHEAAMAAKILTTVGGTDHSVVALVRVTDFTNEYKLDEIEHIIPPFNNFHILRFDELNNSLIEFIQTSWTFCYQNELFFTFARRDQDNNIKQGAFQAFRNKLNGNLFSRLFSDGQKSEEVLHLEFSTSAKRDQSGKNLIFHTNTADNIIPILKNILNAADNTPIVT